MNRRINLPEWSLRWMVFFLLISSCVEPIYFDVPPAELQLIVEGLITDNPGPYTVSLSKALTLDAQSSEPEPVQDATITLFDDEGNSEVFTEISAGSYSTNNIIQGKVGHSYYIRVETSDGKIFESTPDKLNPVGEIEDIRFEYEARTTIKPYGEIVADVFNIFVDSDAGPAEDAYVRWRFSGTYEVLTYPHLRTIWTPPYTPYKAPEPCSGYILIGGPNGGTLVQVDECKCCTCWISAPEVVPQLSDTQLIGQNQFKNIKVGEVPITTATFHKRYQVTVEQMSLSKNAFEFFKLIRAQKEGASSLFQPPSGEIKGNVSPRNTSDPVLGFFWASSVKEKSIFIERSDIPYLITPMDSIRYACTNFPNSTTQKPKGW